MVIGMRKMKKQFKDIKLSNQAKGIRMTETVTHQKLAELDIHLLFSLSGLPRLARLPFLILTQIYCCCCRYHFEIIFQGVLMDQAEQQRGISE